ncbi:insulinase family protein [Kiritimatiellota bacterium B12222]|nr:insulinase family protein [Kiritimatiellota bacterium B12222]
MTLLYRLFLLFVLTTSFQLFTEEGGLQDPQWISGELDNGFRYFIRQNSKPEKRIELRLVVNAGSILEAEDQQGLAHFLEHAAFNGTRNFEKNEMVDFLESLGVGFGPDLNAYTSFDETVYKLRVPTDDPAVVEKAFLILSDWAGGISNTDEALEDERGVIIEEWRGRRGAQARVRDQQYPIIFSGSRYAERLPIGKMDVLENFDFDRLRQFYTDWYRPELMSVIAVGDLDVEKTKSLIEDLFSDLTAPENPPVRETFVHPDHPETIVGTFTDPELTSASVTLLWKMPSRKVNTRTEYIHDIKASLASDMLNQRLAEISQSADAPFLQGGNYQGPYTRGGDVFLLYADVKDETGAYLRAAKVLLTEAERAKQFGFTQAELDRAMARRLRTLQTLVAERENTESDKLASEMVQYALTGEFVPGIEAELNIHQQVLPDITLSEVQKIYEQWVNNDNRVILATGPSHEGENYLPSEEALVDLYELVAATALEPYEDGISDEPLIATDPVPGKVINMSENDTLGTQRYELSNGVTVILKPTTFKQDEILMQAWRAGGTNYASDQEWIAARTASTVAQATGMGSFSAVELDKKLAGQLVSIQAGFTEDQDKISGSASPQDMETLLKLVHLRLTSVRKDPEAFTALQSRMRESVRNRLSDPKKEFSDLVQQTLVNYNPREMPLTVEDVDAMNMDQSLAFFSSRFQQAQGFTFLFIGNVDPETFIPLMEKWIGSLPSTDEPVEPLFLAKSFPHYKITREMHKGLEPVAQVQMVWTRDDFVWNYAERHRLQSMIAAMRIRLREELREKEGGTYHVSAATPTQHYPSPLAQVRIAFTCSPDRVEPLIQNVQTLIENFTTTALEESYAEKVREGQLRRRETDLKENSFWGYVLPFYAWHQEDPQVIFEFDNFVKTVTPTSIQETAKWIFDTPHQAVFILLPAELEVKTPE